MFRRNILPLSSAWKSNLSKRNYFGNRLNISSPAEHSSIKSDFLPGSFAADVVMHLSKTGYPLRAMA
jgi:hypothetical protein